jgi:biopolymer transport protein ExbD
MHFYPRRRKQPPAVIIVALIDILVVLLIFLIVTTTFKQKPALKLALPESKQASGEGVTENAPVIVVEIDRQAPHLRLDGRAVTLEQLEAELKKRAKQSPPPGVALRADKQAPFEQIIAVMDAARTAQLTNLSAFIRGAK